MTLKKQLNDKFKQVKDARPILDSFDETDLTRMALGSITDFSIYINMLRRSPGISEADKKKGYAAYMTAYNNAGPDRSSGEILTMLSIRSLL